MRVYRYVIVLLLLALSCGKMKGEFAFKYPEDKGYRINQSRLEFDSTQEVNWIYKFRSAPGGTVKLGVILMKKELGWVDILTTSDYIDPLKSIVYGTLKDLEQGDYKIVIVEVTSDGNSKIDEVELYLYSDEEPLD